MGLHGSLIYSPLLLPHTEIIRQICSSGGVTRARSVHLLESVDEDPVHTIIGVQVRDRAVPARSRL